MLKTSGWEAALPPSKSNEKKLQPLSAFWSQITAEEPIYCEEAAVKERATSPPSAFTEATLLEAMEEAHKRVNDDALRVVLQKEGGIGTARTRGEILDNLFEKNLLLRDGRKILSTEAGRDEVDSLPASLKTADFTAQTEHLMLEMRSSGDRKFFREQSYDIVRRMIAEVRFVPSRTRAPVDPKTTKRKASSAGGAQQAIRVGGKGQISGSKSSPPGAGGFPRGNPKTI
jgi:DNA topoisomerase-3